MCGQRQVGRIIPRNDSEAYTKKYTDMKKVLEKEKDSIYAINAYHSASRCLGLRGRSSQVHFWQVLEEGKIL